MTDPLSDFFIQIKNGYRARKGAVVVPFSNLKSEIARVLEARKYIGSYEKKGRKVRKFLELKLLYDDGKPSLTEVRLLSKPSRRLYVGVDKIRPVRQGHGLLIVSTSKGVMTGEDAKKERIGGQLIAEVW